jgi:hypothetical protein
LTLPRLKPWTIFFLVLVTIAVALVFISACGEFNKDAPAGERNTGPADIINMPDGFSNVAHKCDGPNMVYVIYHGNFSDPKPYGSLAVVANDPRCGVPQ